MADHWSMLFIYLIVMSTQFVHGLLTVNITYLHSAVARGAVCLDGGPPAYYYAKGFGKGANNWLVYLEGGGWCANPAFCNVWIIDKNNKRGDIVEFSNIFSEDPSKNPDFYNWNRVRVAYCDGASFSGDVEQAIEHHNLYSRGARIFKVVMEDLLAKGMANAQNAILAGSSAGGLATILHCDGFRALIPNTKRVKCISDSGFFIRGNTNDLPAKSKRVTRFDNVVRFHDLAKTLPKSCTSKMNPALCMFPENLVNDIQTPLFLLETSIDSFQIQTGLTPDAAANATWANCAENLQSCTDAQLQLMQDFRTVFVKTVQQLGNSPSRGIFVHTCSTHTHFLLPRLWNPSPVLGNKTIAQAIGDWYFDRSPVHEIDTTHPKPVKC